MHTSRCLFYSNTHPCMYLFCTTIPTILGPYTRSIFPRAPDRPLPLSYCHVLDPMRYSSRIPTVLARPRPVCPDNPGLISRLLSFEAGHANEHLHSPVINHVPHFDWRLRVPSPKPPLSTIQKVFGKPLQPPLPSHSYPYDVHIQKYKDQSVTYRVPALPANCSPCPPAFSLFYHLNARKMRPSLGNASRTGA